MRERHDIMVMVCVILHNLVTYFFCFHHEIGNLVAVKPRPEGLESAVKDSLNSTRKTVIHDEHRRGRHTVLHRLEGRDLVKVECYLGGLRAACSANSNETHQLHPIGKTSSEVLMQGDFGMEDQFGILITVTLTRGVNNQWLVGRHRRSEARPTLKYESHNAS